MSASLPTGCFIVINHPSPKLTRVAASGEIYVTDAEVNIGHRVLRVNRTATPEQGESVTAEAVRGQVTVRQPGTRRFVPLPSDGLIPVGSVVDTTKGTVRLVSSGGLAAKAGGGIIAQQGDFDGGVFQIRQSKSKPDTELRLQGGSFRGCPRSLRSRAAGSPRRRVRRLRGNARGRFRTRGRHSAATVRGTRWTMEDRCDGTLTKVQEGSVTVRDFRKRRNIILRRGDRYLAQPQTKR